MRGYQLGDVIGLRDIGRKAQRSDASFLQQAFDGCRDLRRIIAVDDDGCAFAQEHARGGVTDMFEVLPVTSTILPLSFRSRAEAEVASRPEKAATANKRAIRMSMTPSSRETAAPDFTLEA